jgi:hypothetical protein
MKYNSSVVVSETASIVGAVTVQDARQAIVLVGFVISNSYILTSVPAGVPGATKLPESVIPPACCRGKKSY